MTQLVVVYHSATGRTRALAQAVARGAAAVEGVSTHVLSVEEDPTRLHRALSAADAIVFGAPTYMGSVSAPFKAFMDATSAVWALQGWRDKVAAGFTHSAAPSGDKLATLMQLTVFAAQHGMIWVGLGLPPTYAGIEAAADDTNRLGSHLGAMTQSRPGGGTLPEGDLRTAELLGRRAALVAARLRAGRRREPAADAEKRHPATRAWDLPPAERPPLGERLDRVNLRELVARPARFEHHLLVCASIGAVRLEVTTASEPLYFAHINVSDEYALALPSGDELVDRFPLRTFLTDPETGEDVGRYNHRVGDLVLHPQGLLHWPGRLRPPYEPFEFPPGMRRTGLSLVYCTGDPVEPMWCPLPSPQGREEDAKAYVEPAPPMVLSSIRSQPGVVAKVGSTSLSLVEVPKAIAPPRGGWVVVLEADRSSAYAPCDLVRIADGAELDGRGIVRAIVLSSDAAPPDPPPPLWSALPEPPFAPREEQEPGALPFEERGVRVSELSTSMVVVEIGGARAEAPRYWLARMLYRCALHGLRLGYVETYGGVFVDDRGERVRFGVRAGALSAAAAVKIGRGEAMAVLERLYLAVAPEGYRERVG